MAFRPHSKKQEKAIFSDKRIVATLTGIQWGKTTVGAVKMKMWMHKWCDSTDNFIILAPTYKILNQSSLPEFERIMQGCGEFNKGDMEFKMRGGGTAYIRTATDANAIVGITKVRGVWIDEAGLLTLYAWENAQQRASFLEAPICITSSPYTLNWLYKEVVRPKMRDPEALADVDLIRAASNENPYFPNKEYQRKKETMAPRRFNMVYGGNWEKAEGLVYSCFDEEENQIAPCKLPQGTAFYGGIDWGFTHPFVLTVQAITPAGMHYQVSEFLKHGMTLEEIKNVCFQAKRTWGIKRFYCGPERPENILALNRAGMPASAANNEVKHGIDIVYELVASRKYKIFNGTSPHTINEFECYHWPTPEDLGPDQDDREPNPVKQDDDALDSIRYVYASITTISDQKNIGRVPGGRGIMRVGDWRNKSGQRRAYHSGEEN